MVDLRNHAIVVSRIMNGNCTFVVPHYVSDSRLKTVQKSGSKKWLSDDRYRPDSLPRKGEKRGEETLRYFRYWMLSDDLSFCGKISKKTVGF